ncbi:hypothetical protein SKA34_16895 [Photobacterium sp. SKA34]|uniref:hypothetical protein n=1 Tax=Photobacterium sp. SKA34 TaxID=121723 RepID=UPI00006BEB54|nr:hypothetical protein [Photobacterium sp. SKA34]EAR55866.1 hypothetical protein SKA34_16895 [Photobacterium sp. SKA34]
MNKKSSLKTEVANKKTAESTVNRCFAQNEESINYDNIFDAVNEEKATFLKDDSDLLIAIRDILTECKISNSVEHQFALKRIEQLWGAKPDTALGKELNKLADIVCKYEEQFLS